MKKRSIVLLICLCLLFAAVPGAGAAEPALSLISVDDLLPRELINTVTYYGSTLYAPYWLFTNYGLGISYSYSAATSTVCMSGGAEKRLYFDMAAGKTYDHDNYQYSVPAIMRGGTIYLPLSFMCGFFGTFSYQNIGGNEYGSILRIRTGGEALTDEEFLRLAKPAIQRYYEEYYSGKAEEKNEGQTGTIGTVGSQPPLHAGDTVMLGLEGLPSEASVEMLDRLGVRACIFLTEEEIRSAPDRIRRLNCGGFPFGICCHGGTAEEADAAAALLWETARVTTAMVLLPADCEGTPGDGYAIFRAAAQQKDSDRLASVYPVTAALERSSGNMSVVLPCGAEDETPLRVLLYFLRDQGFSVRALRPTDPANEN